MVLTVTKNQLNAGLPKSVRAEKDERIRLICPICKLPGIAARGFRSHLRAHGIEGEQATLIAEEAEADPFVWLGALESVEERLEWVRSRIDSLDNYEAAQASLRLAEEVLTKQREDLLEAGHASVFEAHKAKRGKPGRPRKDEEPRMVAEPEPEYEPSESEA